MAHLGENDVRWPPHFVRRDQLHRADRDPGRGLGVLGVLYRILPEGGKSSRVDDAPVLPALKGELPESGPCSRSSPGVPPQPG